VKTADLLIDVWFSGSASGLNIIVVSSWIGAFALLSVLVRGAVSRRAASGAPLSQRAIVPEHASQIFPQNLQVTSSCKRFKMFSAGPGLEAVTSRRPKRRLMPNSIFESACDSFPTREYSGLTCAPGDELRLVHPDRTIETLSISPCGLLAPY
jgi:hypothetical protein